jgi:adenylate kinase
VKYRTVLLFGAPGAGKGTQGKILGTIPGYYHCACGDVFRNLRIDDPMGRLFVDYAAKGQLAPDDATVQLWSKNIQAATLHGAFNPERDTLVLDGLPRTPHQVEMLRDTLDVKALFYLTCSDMGKMIERLQRRALRENRLDDANLETIRQRLDIYHRESKAVVECYPAEIVHRIDSTQSQINVLREILEVLARVK